MGRYKSRELVHFWIDYVKVQIKTEGTLHKKLKLSPNSNISYFDNYTIIELMPEMMEGEFSRFFQIRDIETNVSIAFIAIGWQKKWNITRSEFLEVTGQGLILRGGYKYFVDMMKKLNLSVEKYLRVDVCMDVNVNTQYFLETIAKDFWEKKTRTPWITKGVIHAMYYGEKQLAKNTYQFMRVYNKRLDSINKAKEWLYEQYKDCKDITRLEVEIRRDKACFLTTEKLLDTDYIFGVCVRTFYPINHQFFSFLHLEDFKKVEETDWIWKKRLRKQAERKKLQDIYGCSFKNPKEEKAWEQTFLAYAKKLLVNGISMEKIRKMLDDIEVDFYDELNEAKETREEMERENYMKKVKLDVAEAIRYRN